MDESSLNGAMDRYACGDSAAFRVLHAALHPRIFAFLVRLSGSTTLADDLTQETFLRLHRARATFAAGGAVLPWVYTIARNVHLDHARSRRLRQEERLPSDPSLEPLDGRGDDAEDLAIASQMAHTVERVLASLPATQREAFVLIRYEGLSVQEAAAVLGITETAVKLRAFRAYEALRAELGAARQANDTKQHGTADPAKPTGGEPRRSVRRPRSGGPHGA
ncbi:RNA polymerase sigma factor [Chondromyces apiculatus]|uniref:RNA polymerase sigma-70 factor, ECF subfamily n=1 Tax=Chondromyces apiculatus DSM 436 TaxID=1192034 RepID=A0A017SW59_9BACT|nr:RNA polymerase sigma factor [Chondromyces apiculatus]EYF01199.1 RNA polymerase sigma-70 factor, ECF subfamily [Chondromyces apiculatus DSM 436]